MIEQIWKYKTGNTPYIRDSGRLMSLRSGKWYPVHGDKKKHCKLIKIDIFDLWNKSQVIRALEDHWNKMFSVSFNPGETFYINKDVPHWNLGCKLILTANPNHDGFTFDFVSVKNKDKKLSCTVTGMYRHLYVTKNNPVQSPITEESAKRKERADKTKSLLLVN